MTAAMEWDRLTQSVQLFFGRGGHVHYGQGVQVTLVGGVSYVLIVIEVAHAFVHGKPEHLLLSLPRARTAHAELTGLVDDGFDAEDQTELVVHFEPVVLHAMFDTGSRPAFFLAVVEQFALEAWIELTAEDLREIEQFTETLKSAFPMNRAAIECGLTADDSNAVVNVAFPLASSDALPISVVPS